MRPNGGEPESVSEVDALWARLAAMERRFRVAAAAALIGAVLAGVLGIGAQRAASQQQAITVRQIAVLDQAGKRRISLTIGGDGNPGIWLYDADGTMRLYAGLVTGRGTPTPEVLLQDERGTQRLYIGWSDTTPEQPLMFVHDESGKELWHAP